MVKAALLVFVVIELICRIECLNKKLEHKQICNEESPNTCSCDLNNASKVCEHGSVCIHADEGGQTQPVCKKLMPLDGLCPRGNCPCGKDKWDEWALDVCPQKGQCIAYDGIQVCGPSVVPGFTECKEGSCRCIALERDSATKKNNEVSCNKGDHCYNYGKNPHCYQKELTAKGLCDKTKCLCKIKNIERVKSWSDPEQIIATSGKSCYFYPTDGEEDRATAAYDSIVPTKSCNKKNCLCIAADIKLAVVCFQGQTCESSNGIQKVVTCGGGQRRSLRSQKSPETWPEKILV